MLVTLVSDLMLTQIGPKILGFRHTQEEKPKFTACRQREQKGSWESFFIAHVRTERQRRTTLLSPLNTNSSPDSVPRRPPTRPLFPKSFFLNFFFFHLFIFYLLMLGMERARLRGPRGELDALMTEELSAP